MAGPRWSREWQGSYNESHTAPFPLMLCREGSVIRPAPAGAEGSAPVLVTFSAGAGIVPPPPDRFFFRQGMAAAARRRRHGATGALLGAPPVLPAAGGAMHRIGRPAGGQPAGMHRQAGKYMLTSSTCTGAFTPRTGPARVLGGNCKMERVQERRWLRASGPGSAAGSVRAGQRRHAGKRRSIPAQRNRWQHTVATTRSIGTVLHRQVKLDCDFPEPPPPYWAAASRSLKGRC